MVVMPQAKVSDSSLQISSGFSVMMVAALERSMPSTRKSTVFKAAL